MTMQPWFPAAKLGIFIHYGIYAVDGVPESWSLFDGSVPYEAYMKQLDGFTASRYDPRAGRICSRARAPDTPCSPRSTTTDSHYGTPRTAT